MFSSENFYIRYFLLKKDPYLSYCNIMQKILAIAGAYTGNRLRLKKGLRRQMFSSFS